jgi:hypothetical protein
MNPLQATAQILRNTAAGAEISADMRRRWHDRLRDFFASRWNATPQQTSVHISRRVHVGGGGRMLRALVRCGDRACGLRVKWCPHADPAAVVASFANLRWWRGHFPQLATAVPETLDYWPDDRVLIIEERPGQPLGDDSGPLDVVPRLARWMHAYANSPAPTDDAIDPRLGAAVQRGADNRLTVNVAPLLATRLDAAEEASQELQRLGVGEAAGWKTRFDPENLFRTFAQPQPAGFVHGDFKPGNVLVTEVGFSIVDWWIAPCMSWPLTDIATFAGNLWLMNSPAARRIWDMFSRAYFPEGINADTARVLDFVGTALCLGYLARRMRHPACQLLERRRCSQLVQRLSGPATAIGRIQSGRGGEPAADLPAAEPAHT